MDESTLLKSILTKFYGKSEQEVTDAIYTDGAINENAFETISTMDAARVTKLKGATNTDKLFQNGYAKGKEETKKADIQAIKEHFGIETDSDQFDEVIEAGKLQIDEKTKVKVTPLTEDQVKTHPAYLKLEKERVPKTLLEQKEAELQSFKDQVENDKIYSVIDNEAVVHLQKMKPNLDIYKDAPQIVKNQESQYKNDFRKYNYKPDGNGGFIVLHKQDGLGKNGLAVKAGDRVEDEHGNPVTLEGLSKEIAPNYFTFLKQSPKGATGNVPADATNPGLKPSGFKTKADYANYVKNIPKDKDYETKAVEAFEVYKEQIKNGTITE